MAKLVINYEILKTTGRNVRQMKQHFDQISDFRSVYPDYGGGATPTLNPTTVDVTQMISDSDIGTIPDRDLRGALGHFQDQWRPEFSEALTTMAKAAAWFEAVADGFFQADAQTALSLQTSGYDPASFRKSKKEYEQQINDYKKQKEDLEKDKRDHPDDPHAGMIKHYDANGNPYWTELGPPPTPPGPQPGVIQTPDGSISTTVTYGPDGIPTGYTTTVTDTTSGQSITSTTTYQDDTHWTTDVTDQDNHTTHTATAVEGNPDGDHTESSTSTDYQGNVTQSTTTVTVSAPDANGMQTVTETTTDTPIKNTTNTDTTPTTKTTTYRRPAP